MKKQPPKRKKAAPKKPSNDATMLQRTVKKRRGGDNAKTSQTRHEFLQAFEASFGNISFSCETAKIDRATYYRWMKSETRINKKFQEKIIRLKPAERQVDFAEAALMKRIALGDTTAIIFTLKTKGKQRGYAEISIADNAEEAVALAQLKKLIERRAEAKGIGYAQELQNYLNLFGSDIKPEIKEELTSNLIQ